MLVTQLVGRAQRFRQQLAVLKQFASIFLGSHCVVVVVFQSLMTRDISDGVERRPSELAGPFRDDICHLEELFALFVQKKVVIAKMTSTHVPVKILGLDIEREYVGKQMPEFA